MYNVHIGLEWDENKNRENIKKHKISFEEAANIFFNKYLEVFHDPFHSENEERYIAIGFNDRGKVLLVVHSEDETGNKIRIISARRATKKEQMEFYEKRI